MSSVGEQPSQALTKPTFSEAQACALVESVFGLKVSEIQPLPSYDDQNFHVCISRAEDTTDGAAEYVLKVSNTESSKTPDLIEVQTHIILFLRAAGFPTASVHRTKADNLTSLVSVGKSPALASHRLSRYMSAFWLQAEIPRTGLSHAGMWLFFSAVGRSHSLTKEAMGAQIQKWGEPGSGVRLVLRKHLTDG